MFRSTAAACVQIINLAIGPISSATRTGAEEHMEYETGNRTGVGRCRTSRADELVTSLCHPDATWLWVTVRVIGSKSVAVTGALTA